MAFGSGSLPHPTIVAATKACALTKVRSVEHQVCNHVATSVPLHTCTTIKMRPLPYLRECPECAHDPRHMMTDTELSMFTGMAKRKDGSDELHGFGMSIEGLTFMYTERNRGFGDDRVVRGLVHKAWSCEHTRSQRSTQRT